jgi:hypothetical protein
LPVDAEDEDARSIPFGVIAVGSPARVLLEIGGRRRSKGLGLAAWLYEPKASA